MTPAISVIVAIYQAEAYLKRCVDSILFQSFSDFELLLIDDGSTDRSGEICDEYAQKDSRVRVFHKQNEGRCLTRKKGIEESKGEYTIHCDPDDWMEPTMLEELYKKAKESDSDIVLSDVWIETKKGAIYSIQCPTSLTSQSLINDFYIKVMPSLWNKLIKRDCYTRFDVNFDGNVEYAEDLFLLIQMLVYPLRLAYIPKGLYHYDKQINPLNITQCFDIEVYKRSVDSFLPLETSYTCKPINKLKSDVIWYWFRDGRSCGEYLELYPEIDRFLFFEGVKHPIRNWHYIVLTCHRNHMRWMGEFVNRFVSFAVKFK